MVALNLIVQSQLMHAAKLETSLSCTQAASMYEYVIAGACMYETSGISLSVCATWVACQTATLIQVLWACY